MTQPRLDRGNQSPRYSRTMVTREYAHGRAWLDGIPRQSQGTLGYLSRSCCIMKRGKGLSRFDLVWRDHLRDGQGVDLPPCFGSVDIANRRIRRAEVDTNNE